MHGSKPLVIDLSQLKRDDVPIVGGKNASLGEMIGALGQKGILVPPGFATTADAFRHYLSANNLEAGIAAELDKLAAGKTRLHQAGEAIRALILGGEWPDETAKSILGLGSGESRPKVKPKPKGEDDEEAEAPEE